MVQILPAPETFGSTIGKGLGEGFSQGVSQASNFAMEMAKENQKMARRQKLINKIEGVGPTPSSTSPAYNDEFKNIISQAEEQLGFQLTPEQINSVSNKLKGDGSQQQPQQNMGLGSQPQMNRPEEDPFVKAKKYAAIGEHDLATISGKEAESKIKSAQKSREAEERKATQKRTEDLGFHKESKEYDDKLLDQSRKADNQMEALSNIEKSIKSGNIKPTSAVNILRGTGAIGDKIANALLNNDQATVLSSIPYLIEGWKDIFGVRLSDADLKIIQDKLPDIGKSPEANMAMVKIMRKYSEMSKLRYQIGKEIKEKNNGLRPLGFADQIETQFQNMMKPVKVTNPKTGNVIEIPAYKVSDAVKSGAVLSDE
jgi:hypothetical protein